MENVIQNVGSNKNGEPVLCDECQCDKFQLVFLLEKYNKLLIGSDKDQISPLQVFACLKCGHVNDYFLPNGSQKQS